MNLTTDPIEQQSETEAVEVVAGRLYAIGGAVELDGRISWAAPSATGFMPINGYLVVGEEGALVIDTGIGLHASRVVEQLLSVIPEGTLLSILLTRTEMDCPLNVPAIEDRFEVETVRYTGGLFIPRRSLSARVDRFAISTGEVVVLEAAPGIVLDVRTPRLKLLPTLWPYDPVSRTLFTSDAFAYCNLGTGDGPLLLTENEPMPSRHEVQAQLLAKMEWLKETDTMPIADDIHAVFEACDVEIIAPTHGRIIVGRALVRRHAELLESIVREVGREY